MHDPVCIKTFETGALREKRRTAEALLDNCILCPRKCRVKRSSGKLGVCRTGTEAVVSAFDAHFGEEAPLVGSGGSGTIFFSYCNLLCSFCQNHGISHGGQGERVSPDQLAWMMLDLQRQGCHNINWVTPSHVVPQILAALEIAIPQGLALPLVYNTGGYDRVDTLKLLEGVVDIYMPDLKFFHAGTARLAGVPEDYFAVAMEAVVEMHRQVGDLVVDRLGLARRGLLVRHLVLPENLAGTKEIMAFLAEKVSSETYVNIMAQYRPCGPAAGIPSLSRSVIVDEYEKALQIAAKQGITRLDTRRPRFF
ncbi:MAG: radical SAM protein [Desulfobacteraceae bacterium]